MMNEEPQICKRRIAKNLSEKLPKSSETSEVSLYFRAAAAGKILPLKDGWFQVGDLKMHIESDAPAQIRASEGQAELVVPIRFKDGRARIAQEFQW